MIARNRQIAGVILLQLLPAFGAVEQHKGGEMRQLDSLVEYQRRFHTAIGEENAAAPLRKIISVSGHLNISETIQAVGKSFPIRIGSDNVGAS